VLMVVCKGLPFEISLIYAVAVDYAITIRKLPALSRSHPPIVWICIWCCLQRFRVLRGVLATPDKIKQRLIDKHSDHSEDIPSRNGTP